MHDGPGVGVKGDTKTLDTSVQGGTNVLVTSGGRQATYDAGNTRFFSALPGTLFADAYDVWNLAGRTSPGQPAGVDAHYYARVTDDFYLAVFGRDSLDDAGMQMVSSAHFARNYNNAFWNGTQMTYGRRRPAGASASSSAGSTSSHTSSRTASPISPRTSSTRTSPGR
jgi:bacillolysin